MNRLNDYIDAASKKLASVEKQLAKVNKRRCQGPSYEKKLSKMREKYCKKQRKIVGQKRIPKGGKLCNACHEKKGDDKICKDCLKSLIDDFTPQDCHLDFLLDPVHLEEGILRRVSSENSPPDV